MGKKAACYLDWYAMFSELLLLKNILIKGYFFIHKLWLSETLKKYNSKMVWIDFGSYDISWNGEKKAVRYLDWYTMFLRIIIKKSLMTLDALYFTYISTGYSNSFNIVT